MGEESDCPFNMCLEELEDMLCIVSPYQKSSNKEVYLIVKEQLTFEVEFPAPVKKLGCIQHISFKLQSPSALQY